MKLKRLISAAAASAMLLSAVPFNGIAADGEAEVLVSNDFEESFGTWKARTSGSTEISLSDAQANSGAKSLYVTGRTTGWNGAGASMIKVMYPGQQYDLSIAVFYDDEVGGDNQQFNLQYLYTDSTGTERYKYISSANVKKGEWGTIKGSITIPDDATGVVVYVEAATLSDFYMDDFTVTGIPMTDDSAEDGFSDNFDDGTKMGWQGRGSQTTVEVTDKVSHSGNYCLYTDGRQQLWNGVTCNKALNLTPGGYYKFGCYVMYDGEKWSDTQKFSINLQYDMDGKENYYTLYTDTANKGEWKYIGTEYTIPENATNVYVYVQTAYKPEASVTEQDLMGFYLDDVSAERLPDPAIQKDIASLCDVYKNDFKIGCAATVSELVQSAAKDLILKHYNSLTLGNELKPESLLDQAATIAYMNANGGDQTSPQITLKNAKPLLEFAQENGIEIRGHVLVWHSQTPDWFFKENYDNNGAFVTPEVMDKRMENYIKIVMETLAKEYPDVKFYAWDVVNEAASDAGTIRKAGGYSQGDGSSGWVSVYGDQSYIKKAFTYARKYAPKGCKLFYNDYNEYSDAKMKYIQEEILAPLVKDGLIDGMGMQSHIGMSSPTIDQYEKALRSYAAMGLEVQVTELDVSLKSNTEEDLLALAERYRECFDMYKRVRADGVDLSAVVIWGITDSTSWIGGYPLLFDKDYQAKDAFYAVVDTDAPVQTIKSIPAYIIPAGTTPDKAFEAVAANDVNGKGSFKAAFDSSTGEIVIQAQSAKSVSMTIKGENFKEVTETVSGTKTIRIKPDTEPKEGSTLRLEVIIDGTAWNTLDYSASSNISYGKLTVKSLPDMATAAKGTAVIDGKIDDIWADAPTISLDKYSMGGGAKGTAKILWDSRNIYVLAEVNDPVLSVASTNAYEQDTVEVFLDENNHKSTAYEADDIQCRVSYEGEKTVTDGLSTDRFTSAAVKTDNGYLVEIAISSTLGGFKSGQVVGFDAQINDDGEGQGKRTSIANWYDLSGMGYTDVSGLGLLKLLGDGEASDIVYGDADDNGSVSVSDVVSVLQHTANKQKYGLDSDALVRCDVNGDNDVNASDAFLIQQYDAGVINVFPVK